MMLVHSIATLLAVLPFSGALAGQVPTVNGVVGGVPKATVQSLAVKPSTATSNVTAGALRVTENSGVCESPDVYQASGYGDITANESVWFWFFEARENPDTAPLTLWFNGGPGSSSMVGLFQEHGPCRITNDSSSVVPNPYSWNNVSNMLYIDQPIGVGFSYGTESVGTSEAAAADVWSFMQIFLKDSRFSKYANASLAIWTESYGGHYGPTFANHFLEQNTGIANGTVTGINLNLTTLAIGNGITDPITQYPEYVTYAASNPYYPLVSSDNIAAGNVSVYGTGNCLDQITACNNGGSDLVCSAAQDYCNGEVLSPMAGNWDVYYVLVANPDAYPPSFSTYINSVTSKIGANGTWTETNGEVYNNFATTGDWMRTKKPYLENVINAGIRVHLFDGQVDFICNYMGFEAMINSLDTQYSAEYNAASFQNYTVDGQVTGLYKTAGTFSYVRVYGAGHEVAAYNYGSLAYGQAALQFFSQIMSGDGLSST
ncbi:serine carboxypeptidase [Athelia psychrophila]|uniref:Carboxypeptidase n=1 Tax=Athelia psychrophila TaxID=1759441 RepID=A0A166BBY7_9AGAM|nr:serine carboxypeptidase [Fibularhizoctonia sp. CBS 109695]